MSEFVKMVNAVDFLKKETRQRCQIIEWNSKLAASYSPVSHEQFFYLNNVNKINFKIYLRIENNLIEYIKPEEFSKELLGHIRNASQNSPKEMTLFILKSELAEFQKAVSQIRQDKIQRLIDADPLLDRQTLNSFSNLSQASQLIVKGGIDLTIAKMVETSTAYLMNNLFDIQAAIATLSKMVVHDPTLYDHSASVAMMSGIIAKSCLDRKLSKRQLETIAQCGLYHDVGKTCIPSKILNKPGQFTPEEFEIMKEHAALGQLELEQIIDQGTPLDPILARVAGEHHERFCGSGYPHGRKGRAEEEHHHGIHLFTRVVTIADVYSALLMARVYKPPFSPEQAIKIMNGTAQDDYDPKIFKAFLEMVSKSLVNPQNPVKNPELITIVYQEGSEPKTKKKAS